MQPEERDANRFSDFIQTIIGDRFQSDSMCAQDVRTSRKDVGFLRKHFSEGPIELPVNSLPTTVVQQMADFYKGVGSQANLPGSAQAAFNQARANYLLGIGPNPGPNVADFAKQAGLSVLQRKQSQ